MGRRLANSAVEEESWLLANSDLVNIAGFFQKRKRNKFLVERWRNRGWGRPDFKNHIIQERLLTCLSAGFFHGALESVEESHFKVRWEDRGPTMCQLSFDPVDRGLMKTQPPPLLFGEMEVPNSDESLVLDIESDFQIEGKRHCLLPAGLFARLLESTAGLQTVVDKHTWDLDNLNFKFKDGFIAMAEAMKKLFLSLEQHILILEPSDWIDICHNICSNRGFGIPVDVESLDKHGGVSLNFEILPFAPLTVGLLAAAWQRAEGRPVKVKVSKQSGSFAVNLSSFHKIA
jgi:hypothetical protein